MKFNFFVMGILVQAIGVFDSQPTFANALNLNDQGLAQTSI